MDRRMDGWTDGWVGEGCDNQREECMLPSSRAGWTAGWLAGWLSCRGVQLAARHTCTKIGGVNRAQRMDREAKTASFEPLSVPVSCCCQRFARLLTQHPTRHDDREKLPLQRAARPPSHRVDDIVADYVGHVAGCRDAYCCCLQRYAGSSIGLTGSY